MKFAASILLLLFSRNAQAFTIGSSSRTRSNHVLENTSSSKLSAADIDTVVEETSNPTFAFEEVVEESKDTPKQATVATTPKQEEPVITIPTPSKEDDIAAFNELQEIAIAANPIVRYFDPLNLVEANIGQWSRSKSDTIGWLRHAEIKHSRVAMAAFVGYCVQAQGVRFPFTQELWPNVSGPEAQWDALDVNIKLSIILTVGFLELLDEVDQKGHYTRGKKEPGRHPVFQRETKASQEALAEGRIKEINNGRLAMLGIMGLVSSSSVPGSVPLLDNIDFPAYEGNVWAPFAADFTLRGQATSSIVEKAVESVESVAAAVPAVPDVSVESVVEKIADTAIQAASTAATTIPSEFALMQ